MSIKNTILVAALMALVGSASAAELLMTDSGLSKARNAGSTLALDIVSDGDVAGFDLIIPVPKGVKVNTAKCLASLPAGFQGVCKHNEGEVAVIAVSMNLQALPAGVHSIGTLSISGGQVARTATMKFNAVGVDAKSLTSTVQTNFTPASEQIRR